MSEDSDDQHYEIDDDSSLEPEDTEKSLALWRKLGLVGKVHNLVKFVRGSPQRSKKL